MAHTYNPSIQAKKVLAAKSDATFNLQIRLLQAVVCAAALSVHTRIHTGNK